MATTILLKRGNSTAFESATLAAGEPAFVLDTGKLYIGDGTNKVAINEISKPAGLDTASSFTKYKVNDYGQIVSQESLAASDITGLLGSAAVADTGTSEGNVPLLGANGKLSDNVVPNIAITDTFVVANETEMLSLTAEVGDLAVRTDLHKSFILKTSGASTPGNWQELLTPTGEVTSVNGKTEVVVLTSSDLDMTGYTKATSYSAIETTDSTSEAIGKLEKNFDNYISSSGTIDGGTL